MNNNKIRNQKPLKANLTEAAALRVLLQQSATPAPISAGRIQASSADLQVVQCASFSERLMLILFSCIKAECNVSLCSDQQGSTRSAAQKWDLF